MWRSVLLLTMLAGSAQAACLDYPGRHALDGTLVRRTFAGPPNYESVRAGDRPETYFLLRLPKPICIADDPADREGLSEGTKDIRDIQLMLEQSQYDRLRPRVGRRIRLSGTFMSAITGHHHTPILLQDVKVGLQP